MINLKYFYCYDVDHDECGSNNHDCDHQCHNTQGGYYCSCNNGYKLQQGTTTCVGMCACVCSQTDGLKYSLTR